MIFCFALTKPREQDERKRIAAMNRDLPVEATLRYKIKAFLTKIPAKEIRRKKKQAKANKRNLPVEVSVR